MKMANFEYPFLVPSLHSSPRCESSPRNISLAYSKCSAGGFLYSYPECISLLPSSEARHLQNAFCIDVGVTTITTANGIQQRSIGSAKHWPPAST